LSNESDAPSPETFFGCDTPEIKGYVAGENYDAFVLNGWYLKSHWQAVWACRRNGVPVLVRGDSQLRTPRARWKQLAKEVGYRGLLRLFDGFLYVGTRNRAYLRHYGIPDERLFFCPRFVDNDWFRQRAKEARGEVGPLRRRMVNGEAPGDDPVDETTLLLFVGKFIEKKRPQDLLDAADRLHANGHDVAVAYVGAGPLGDSLRQKGAEAAVPVHFAGFKNQTELPRYYAAADLLVLPSDGRETWGLVVNEGMACGLPAVVSDAVGCAPDLIDSGTTGEQYPVGNVSRLAEAVDDMLPCLGTTRVQERVAEKMRKYSLNTTVNGLLDAVQAVS
jgi:glycosyltransferase involved in cell wall biosynthesis